MNLSILDVRTQKKEKFLATSLNLGIFHKKDSLADRCPFLAPHHKWFMGTTMSVALPSLLSLLLARRDLSEEQTRQVIEDIFAGRLGEMETAAFLIALRAKGEASSEIAGGALALRAHMVLLETGRDDVLDTSGTGGDGLGTFNISTATALVAAGAGAIVVKNGNRAVSGRSGSTDVLATLGVRVEGDVDFHRRCLECAGLTFCFAPNFHPIMSRVAPIRRRLGVPTLFNCLGPLGNPAGATYRLMGIGRTEWLDPVAGALARLGARKAILVHSRDGLDEVSLSAPTLVRQVQNGVVTAWEWTAADFGLAPCSVEELRAESPSASAAILQAVLAGQDGPPRRIVLANAAAALLAAERVSSLREGVDRAAEALDSGRVCQVLERLLASSLME
jgi:anthranilate phosphoribosyltransferase